MLFRSEERRAALNGQIRQTEKIISRFTRRRDHLLTAGEENPGESRQAAELAATADRLRKDAEHSLRALNGFLVVATAQSRKSAELVERIDVSMNRLADAVKNLELVRLERASRERIAELERTSIAELQQLGRGTRTARPGTLVQSEASDPGIDDYVREVTRLTYEAEALADLQRESAS